MGPLLQRGLVVCLRSQASWLWNRSFKLHIRLNLNLKEVALILKEGLVSGGLSSRVGGGDLILSTLLAGLEAPHSDIEAWVGAASPQYSRALEPQSLSPTQKSSYGEAIGTWHRAACQGLIPTAISGSVTQAS